MKGDRKKGRIKIAKLSFPLSPFLPVSLLPKPTLPSINRANAQIPMVYYPEPQRVV